MEVIAAGKKNENTRKKIIWSGFFIKTNSNNKLIASTERKNSRNTKMKSFVMWGAEKVEHNEIITKFRVSFSLSAFFSVSFFQQMENVLYVVRYMISFSFFRKNAINNWTRASVKRRLFLRSDSCGLWWEIFNRNFTSFQWKFNHGNFYNWWLNWSNKVSHWMSLPNLFCQWV